MITEEQEKKVLEVQDMLVDTARGFRMEGQQVMTVGFVISAEGDLVFVPIIQFDKDKWSTVLRAVARESGGIAAGLVDEAFAAMPTGDSHKDATVLAAHQAGVPLEELGAQEIILCYMETSDGRERHIYVELKGDGGIGATDDSGLAPIVTHGQLTGYFGDADK